MPASATARNSCVAMSCRPRPIPAAFSRSPRWARSSYHTSPSVTSSGISAIRRSRSSIAVSSAVRFRLGLLRGEQAPSHTLDYRPSRTCGHRALLPVLFLFAH